MLDKPKSVPTLTRSNTKSILYEKQIPGTKNKKIVNIIIFFALSHLVDMCCASFM